MVFHKLLRKKDFVHVIVPSAIVLIAEGFILPFWAIVSFMEKLGRSYVAGVLVVWRAVYVLSVGTVKTYIY